MCSLLPPQAVEYLLWASICMESSVPLLSIRYLTWRATLYTAVCQCHYDCQASIHGEVRGLQMASAFKMQHVRPSPGSPGNTAAREGKRGKAVKLPLLSEASSWLFSFVTFSFYFVLSPLNSGSVILGLLCSFYPLWCVCVCLSVYLL